MIGREGVEQAAVAVLRAAGGGEVMLMLPQAMAADAQTGLGLEAPPLGGVKLAPVLLRTVNGKLMAQMSSGTLEKALNGLTGAQAIEQALLRSYLQAGETQYRIVAVAVESLGGEQALYKLGIEA